MLGLVKSRDHLGQREKAPKVSGHPRAECLDA